MINTELCIYVYSCNIHENCVAQIKVLMKKNGMYDVFMAGDHNSVPKVPSHGISNRLKEEVRNMIKSGGRPGKIEWVLKGNGELLPDNFRDKVVNVAKFVRSEDKKLIGNVNDLRGLTHWFKNNHVNKK